METMIPANDILSADYYTLELFALKQLINRSAAQTQYFLQFFYFITSFFHYKTPPKLFSWVVLPSPWNMLLLRRLCKLLKTFGNVIFSNLYPCWLEQVRCRYYRLNMPRIFIPFQAIGCYYRQMD